MMLNLLNPELIALAVVMILMVTVVAWPYVRKHKSTNADLRQRLGTEYERAGWAHGTGRTTEAKTGGGEKRVQQPDIRDLGSMERESLSKRWTSIQARFVNSPRDAVIDADDLVRSVARTRGYPIDDVDQLAAGVFIEHPRVVDYRTAHAIVLRLGQDEATAETLSTAMMQLRSLFEDLMQVRRTTEKREAA